MAVVMARYYPCLQQSLYDDEQSLGEAQVSITKETQQTNPYIKKQQDNRRHGMGG